MFAKLKKKLEEEEKTKHTEKGRNVPRSPPQHTASGLSSRTSQVFLSRNSSQQSLHSSSESLASVSNSTASSSTPAAAPEMQGSQGQNTDNGVVPEQSCDAENESSVNAAPDALSEDKLREMHKLVRRSSSRSSDPDKEASNIRHLLVKNQQELRECEATIRKKDEELKEAQGRVSQLEDEVKQLKQQLSSNSEKKQVKRLKEEKAALEKEVDRLKQDSLATANRTSQLEKTLSELTDEHDALKHTHEVYKRKSGSIIDDKQNQVDHLQNKVAVLEQRLQDSSLPSDDRFKALVAERDGLEKKLDETVQQLNEIKSTWSEKINSLESQIFHLNKKIAEDNEDTSALEEEIKDLRTKLKDKESSVWKLEETVEAKEKEIKDLKHSLEEEVSRLKCSSEKREEELTMGMSLLDQQLAELTRERDRERQEAQLKINNLMASESDHIEKEIEMENKLSSAEDENRKLKVELNKKEKECATLLQNLNALKAVSTDAQIKVSELEHENRTLSNQKKSLEKELQERQEEVQRISKENEELRAKNAELVQKLDSAKEELSQECLVYQQRKEEDDAEIQKLQTELQSANSKVQELEVQASEYVENSTRVQELKTLVSELEKSISEKNRTIKLQQQRLNDMKKMLQKELKFQANSGTEQGAEIPLDSSSLAPLPSMGKEAKQNSANAQQQQQQSKEFLNSKHIARIGALNQDDIGFQYLRHVVFKFMTSSEYEAQHLTKAVSVLLQFTPEEERLIRETLEWKTSWFGPKPQAHKAQKGRHFHPL